MTRKPISADLARDADLIPQVQQHAYLLWKKYPDKALALIHRWLGSREHFSNA